jgi:iron complex outermembrane receptor protein
MVGVDGELRGGDTTWEVYLSKGDTNIEKLNHRLPSLQRYQALVAAPNFGRGTVTAPSGYNIQCPSGLPVFEQFTPDASCLDGIDTNMIDKSHLTQDIIEGSIQGKLVDNWAGEIRYAAGATYRENSFQFLPGNPAGAVVDNPIGIFASNATGGDIDVTEYYGELLVPLAESLDLELGYRYSDFSTAGGQDTYKALFTWQGTDNITFRGGAQVATRAPNVAELFTAPTRVVVFFPGQEPCSATTQAAWGNLPSNPDRQQVQDLCREIIGNNTSDFDTQTYSVLLDSNGNSITGPDGWHRRNPPYFPLAIELRQGNPNVAPEQGKTYTLGGVFEEAFGLDNLIVTLDFYKMEITDSISPVSVSTIYDNCFNRYGTNPTYDIGNPFCQLIERNAVTGDRAQVQAVFSNLGIIETQGVDMQVNWAADFGPGTFAMSSTISFLDSFKYQTAPGQAIVDATGTLDQGGLYDNQAFTTFRYSWDKLSLGLNWRYLSSVEDAAKSIDPNTPNLGTGSYSNFALNGTYAMNKYSFRFGIDNLFDEAPNNIGGVDPAVDTNSNSTFPAIYDVLGRSYFVGIDMSF